MISGLYVKNTFFVLYETAKLSSKMAVLFLIPSSKELEFLLLHIRSIWCCQCLVLDFYHSSRCEIWLLNPNFNSPCLSKCLHLSQTRVSYYCPACVPAELPLALVSALCLCPGFSSHASPPPSSVPETSYVLLCGMFLTIPDIISLPLL